MVLVLDTDDMVLLMEGGAAAADPNDAEEAEDEACGLAVLF